MLSTVQVGALSEGAINALLALGSRGSILDRFSSDQSQALTTGQISSIPFEDGIEYTLAISSRQISGLSTSQLRALSPAQMVSLTPSQLAGLSSTQVKARTSDQLFHLNSDGDWLRSSQTAHLASGQFAGLDADISLFRPRRGASCQRLRSRPSRVHRPQAWGIHSESNSWLHSNCER